MSKERPDPTEKISLYSQEIIQLLTDLADSPPANFRYPIYFEAYNRPYYALSWDHNFEQTNPTSAINIFKELLKSTQLSPHHFPAPPALSLVFYTPASSFQFNQYHLTLDQAFFHRQLRSGQSSLFATRYQRFFLDQLRFRHHYSASPKKFTNNADLIFLSQTIAALRSFNAQSPQEFASTSRL